MGKEAKVFLTFIVGLICIAAGCVGAFFIYPLWISMVLLVSLVLIMYAALFFQASTLERIIDRHRDLVFIAWLSLSFVSIFILNEWIRIMIAGYDISMIPLAIILALYMLSFTSSE